jgi:hypothetical protein
MDLNYLFHRQQVERTRAEAADTEEARTAHNQLARCYEAQINQATDGVFEFPVAASIDSKRATNGQ